MIPCGPSDLEVKGKCGWGRRSWWEWRFKNKSGHGALEASASCGVRGGLEGGWALGHPPPPCSMVPIMGILPHPLELRWLEPAVEAKK